MIYMIETSTLNSVVFNIFDKELLNVQVCVSV